MGYLSREGEGVERTSAERVEAAGPHHHHDSDCAMAYRLNACVCVNGGHFERKF